MRSVEGISTQYLLSVRYTSGDILVYGDLASALTSVRSDDLKVSALLPCPYGGHDLRLFSCASIILWFLSCLT
jgi:hypothetical protein